MALTISLIRELCRESSQGAWTAVLKSAWETCASDLPNIGAANEVTGRDRKVADLDLFLSSAGWDLWSVFEESAPKTSDSLVSWWESQASGRAVLILDGLSLREVPWILQGAAARGYVVRSARVTGSELPSDTNSFARALGFPQRSALENDQAGSGHKLAGARTDSVQIPFKDCVRLIGPEPRWVLWHHWPDVRLHALSEAGQGLNVLTNEVQAQLTSDDFWSLVERLTTGRTLIITADHGYGASGLFSDSRDEQADYLRQVFKSGRFVSGSNSVGPWVPPVSMTISSHHGTHQYALGRRKWKSPGGYPTLVHGGLSVLEMVVPFIELGRKA
jgi:hypothetical protein